LNDDLVTELRRRKN